MTKYRVFLTTTASLSVNVEIDDAKMDEDEAREAAIEEAHQEAPSGVCAQCSGWGRSWGLDLGEWEAESEPPEKVG